MSRSTGDASCDEYRHALSRRGVLTGLGIGALSWAAKGSAIAQLAISPRRRDGNVLVVLFLRGGADGLSLVVPFGDDAYYRLRPSLGIPERETIRVDGFFGLNRSLAALRPAYESCRLAIVHAVGSDDQTHSHFEAMDTMERGVARRDGPSSGWLARYLSATGRDEDSPLRAVAFGTTMPTSLVGATSAIALESLADFRLDADATTRRSLARMYGDGSNPATHAGRETLKVLDSLERLDVRAYRPQNGAKYPDSDLGRGLKQVACLVRGEIGLEVACLDKGGWDTHVAQANLLPSLLEDLGGSMAAFAQDLGDAIGRVTLIAVSEFGRRIAENSGLGTDHGHAGAMFVLGGGVRGGKVHGPWPGLGDAVGPGDLRVTTDYRDVLGEVLERRMRPCDVSNVLVGYRSSPVGVVGGGRGVKGSRNQGVKGVRGQG